MAKKIYRMTLKEFKSLIQQNLREAVQEVVDEGMPPLQQDKKKRFEELKQKKLSSALSPEEKKEYLSLLQGDVAAKRDATKHVGNKMAGVKSDALPAPFPTDKVLDENKSKKKSSK